MSGNKRSPHALLIAVACLALVADLSAAAPAQEPAAPSEHAKRSQAKRSVAKTTPRPKGETLRTRPPTVLRFATARICSDRSSSHLTTGR